MKVRQTDGTWRETRCRAGRCFVNENAPPPPEAQTEAEAEAENQETRPGGGGNQGSGGGDAGNPNDFADKKGACADAGGYDVRTDGCRFQRKTVQQRADEMTGQGSRADGGEGTNQTVIGPDAVTDYEHGNRRGGGGGFNPIDMKDPPKGVPGGASLDEAMGAESLN